MKKTNLEERIIAAIRKVFSERRREGGQTLQASKTPEERSAAGKKAARARWAKLKEPKP